MRNDQPMSYSPADRFAENEQEEYLKYEPVIAMNDLERCQILIQKIWWEGSWVILGASPLHALKD